MGDGYAVLAIRRKDVVVVPDSITRTDLRGLLADGGDPQAELPLTLKCLGLFVETTHARHVAIELEEVGLG